MRLPFALAALMFSVAALGATPAQACGPDTPCEVAHGRYFVRPPASWDASAALPVAVYFHGYRSSAADVMADKDLGEALSKAGILLVAPDGLGGGWTIPDRLSSGRDDIEFTREVVADVGGRFPVDKARLIATGFSAGGFLVWEIACRAGDLFAAYAPVAGAFLDPIPETCPTGPVSLRHVHGTSDVTVPMAGRPIAGGRVRQSDVRESVARLRAVDGCPAKPSRETREGDLDCQTWAAKDCASGRELALCLHADGHMLNPRWIVDAFAWARDLPAPPEMAASGAKTKKR